MLPTEIYCPFCHAVTFQSVTDASGHYHLHCTSCGATGPKAKTALLAKQYWANATEGERLLRTVIDETPDIIIKKDWDGKFLLCNQALANLYGTTVKELVGKSDNDFNPNKNQVDFLLQSAREIMLSGETRIIQEHSTNAETGEVHHFLSINKPLKNVDGQPEILVIAHDITELRKAHKLIEERERRYEYAMAAAGEGIWDWDIRKNIVTHNAKWCELLNLDKSSQQHPMKDFVKLIYEPDRAAVNIAIDKALRSQQQYVSEHRMQRSDGKLIWVYDRGEVVERDNSGQPTRMVGSMSDISTRKLIELKLAKATEKLAKTNQQLDKMVKKRTAELAKANEELHQLARQDVLTGIANRLAANEHLHNQFSLMKNTQKPYAVMLLDIDNFKKVNDFYGHPTGDQVLKQIAKIIKSNIRENDFVARFGGEEFLVILQETELENALHTAERIRHAIHAAKIKTIRHITASIGLCQVTSAHLSEEEAIFKADQALYVSKNNGRNQLTLAQQ